MKIIDNYDIKKSINEIGQLYPVLLDSTGAFVIDGSHRLQADPKWPVMKLDHINDKKDIMVARIISNICRREVSPYEKADMFNQLAEILLKKDNIPKKDITKKISKLTGVSYRTVSRYLSKKYKAERMARYIKKNGARLATVNLEDTRGFKGYRKEIRAIKLFGLEANNTQLVTIVETSINPMQEIPSHSHRSNFYNLCLKGKGKFIGDTKEFLFSESSVIFVKKDLPHTIINLGKENLVLLSLYFPPIKLDDFIKEDHPQPKQAYIQKKLYKIKT